MGRLPRIINEVENSSLFGKSVMLNDVLLEHTGERIQDDGVQI